MEEPQKGRIDWKHKKEMKVCYTISEVAKMYGVSESVLRYWEQVSPLSPRRSKETGTRYYHREHLMIVDRLHYLIVLKGLTAQAAVLRLKETEITSQIEARDRLLEVRARLEALRDEISKLVEPPSRSS